MLICDDLEARAAMSEAEFADSFAKVMAWFDDHTRNGRIIENSGRRLQRPNTAKTVHMQRGTAVVTDGPFAETKEVLGGYALIEAPTIEAAVEIVKGWPGASAAIEVRPVLTG
jgi:hypothetical protein